MKGSSSPILCRSAGSVDTREALELVKGIWGGEDYVPEVWDHWLADIDGLLAVAVWQGQVVGIGHLSDLGWSEAWLEGLRVAPDLQGQGIGSRLHDYFVGRWLAGGSSVVRLLTHEHREAVKAMCANTGFEPIARVQFRSGRASQGAHSFELAANDAQRAIESLMGQSTSRACAGLMDLGWELAELAADRLLHTPGIEIWSWRDGQGWLATRRDPANPDPEITLCTASREGLPDLLSESRCLASELGVEEVHWLAPDSPEIFEALDAAGFESDDPSEFLLAYERCRR
jgi:GNAT superfamily N-acetyltransferase